MGTRETRGSVAAVNAIANELSAEQNQQNASDDKRAVREKVTIGLLIATVFFTAVGDCIFYRTMEDAKNTANRQLRAYVTFVAPKANDVPNSDIISINIEGTNGGATPTRGLQVSVGAKGYDTKMSDPWIEPKPIRSVVTLGPHQAMPFGVRQMLKGQLSEFQTKHFYIWGRARYRDVLTPEIGRITEFCYEMIPTGGGFGFLACENPARNCTDEECKDK